MIEFAIFVFMNGLVLAGGVLVVRYGFGFLDRRTMALGGSLVAWVYVVVGLESLGYFGLIRMGPALLLAASGFAIGLACWAMRRTNAGDAAGSAGPARIPEPAGSAVDRWSVSIPLAVAAVLCAWAALDLLITGLCSPVRVVSDAPIYHLYFAVQWWKSGLVEVIATPFGETAAPYFPANANIWFTWLVLPWSSELAAKVGQWPFLGLGMGAIWAVARELPVRASVAAFPAVLWGTASLPLIHSAIADVDLIMAAWYMVAVWFLIRYVRTRRGAELLCAALAMGAALGTKYIAILFVGWLVPVAAFFAWRGGHRWRDLAALACGILVPSAYWYGRNLLLTGNPLYPLHVQFGGHVVFAGWYTRGTMLANEFYHIPVFPVGEQFPVLLQMLLRGMDPVLLPVWIAGLGVAVWEAGRGRRVAVLLAGLAVLHILSFWFVNPYQTQERFMFAAFALMSVPLATCLSRWPWLAWIVTGLIGWHLVTDQFDLGIGRMPGPLPAPIRLGWGADRMPHPASVARLAMLASVAVAVILTRGSMRRRGMVAVPVAMVILTGGVLFRAAYAQIKEPALRFYPMWLEGGFLPGWYQLEEATRGGARVAYAGTNLPYYLFGVGLRNQVRYVNVDAHGDFLMHDYHALWSARGAPLSDSPTPDWDRRAPDEAAWLRNLREQRIEFLFIGLTNRAGGEHNVHDAEGFPIERTWADRNPAVFQAIHRDRFTHVFAVRFDQ